MTTQAAINHHNSLVERARALRVKQETNPSEENLTTLAALEHEISRFGQAHNPKIAKKSKDAIGLI